MSQFIRLSKIEQQKLLKLVIKVNEERASNGLEPIKISDLVHRILEEKFYRERI